MSEEKKIIIKPQEGFQEYFAASSVDVIFGGGNLGGGKSYGLVLALAEPLMTDPDFRALISRRSLGSVKSGGGFVEKFKSIFGNLCSVRQSDSPRISFDSGAFCDLTYIDCSDIDKLRERVKGWEYDVIAIDELTEMTWEAFLAVMTRNRGQSKTFTGKFFATMNPKCSHWVREFLDWYISPTGEIYPERDGCVRYFYNTGRLVKDVVWGNSKEEVYRKCRTHIDNLIRAMGGEGFTYKNFIKSFVFYQGSTAENKAMLGNNPDYVGSVAASGGVMSEALIARNWNADPDEANRRAITGEMIRNVFTEDPAVNGDMWITVDLADYGKDNLVALVWNGFHIIDIKMVSKSRPVDNASIVKALAAKHGIGSSHVIYDATSARYFSDYMPQSIPYLSAMKPRGMYKNEAVRLKDECYLRLCKMMAYGHFTMSRDVADRVYKHEHLHIPITVELEFQDECKVVAFTESAAGKLSLEKKSQMNRNLGKGRSMDLLDPCAMRMLPCLAYEYGTEIHNGSEDVQRRILAERRGTVGSIYDSNIWS